MSSDIILSIENVSKLYRLGNLGTGTFGGDVQRFWKTKVLGQEDPFLKIGQTNDRTSNEKAEFVWALKDINFEVKRGEVLGIIGKNGAGKSTLLKLLSRITSPTSGSIKSAGRMASLLEVGTGFHHELTGRENIFLNGAILGMTKKEIQSKFDEIVEFSGCQLYIDTPTKRYSSGMTVRLGFAVAAFLNPEILVVDEVLAVGDAEFQKKAIEKMKEVSQGNGKTILFVSHNLDSVRQLCSKGLVLHNGTISCISSISEALSFYSTELKNVQNCQKNTNKFDNVSLDIYIGDKQRENISLVYKTEIIINLIWSNCVNDKIKIAINIINRDDLVICQLSVKDYFDNFNKQGSHQWRVPGGILKQGEYTIGVGIKDVFDHNLYIDNFLKFRILYNSEELTSYRDKDQGIINLSL
jgi:lipopolysaccharide transport system ATP-binding protein